MAPVAPHFNGFQSALDSHEDRLQRVEETMQDIGTKVAEIGVTTEYLKDSTERAHESISNRIEQLFSEIRSQHQSVADKLVDHATKMDDLNDRVLPIEAHVAQANAKSKETWDNWKKILMGVAIAAAGVLGTKGVEWLMERL